VEVGDYNGLKNVIIQMVENLDETKKMGERALELYDKQYDYEIAMEKYRNMFIKILSI